MSQIHPTAIVDSNAELGKNVAVGPFSTIGADVFVGDGTQIGSHVHVSGPTRIGEDCRIFPFTVLGTDSQDKKYDPAKRKGRLEIGNRCHIREYVSINRGSYGDTPLTKLGDECHVLAYCHIAHDCLLGNKTTLSNGVALAGHVKIGNCVTAGGFVAIHQFLEVGDYCMLSSKSLVKSNVPPFVLVHGSENAKAATINKIGLERNGFPAEEITLLRKAFKAFYGSAFRSEGTQALESIAKESSSQALRNFVDFVNQHERLAPSALKNGSPSDRA